jgi:hypothetical protein
MDEIFYSDSKKSKEEVLTDIKNLKPLGFKINNISNEQKIQTPRDASFVDLLKNTKKSKNKNKKTDEIFVLPQNNEFNSRPTLQSLYTESLYSNDDDDEDDNDIIGEQRRGYGKLKKENSYKKEFAEELTLLYDLLHESKIFGKELEKIFKASSNSKVRGASKYMNDIASNIISVKNNKLSILKEISNIKKVIADLKLKETKGKSDSGEEASAERIASNYLKSILSHGRNRFIQDISDQREPHELETSYHQYDNSHANDIDDEEREDLDTEINDRLERDGNPYRSSEGSKYIEMENRGIQTMIEKNIDSGEWRFINVDRDMQKVNGFPLPNTNNVKMKFSDGSQYATDQWNHIYKIIEVIDDFY